MYKSKRMRYLELCEEQSTAFLHASIANPTRYMTGTYILVQCLALARKEGRRP